MADSYDVIVLGSGANELTCAAYLAKGGRKVLVLESAGVVGGASAPVAIAPGFRCPIASADAGWLSKKVLRELELAAHGLDAQATDPSLVALGAEGPPIVLGADLAKARASISEHSKADADRWEAFATQMDRLAGFLETLYVKEAIELVNPAAGDMIELAAHGLRLRRLGKVDMVELLRVLPMSLQDLLDDWFETAALKGAIAATGLGNLFQGPKSQGTGFTLLHHLVGRELGAFGARAFPRSERGGLVGALTAACTKLGVELRAGVDARVRVEGGRATGVTLPDGTIISARAVATGADPRRALTGQLDAWHLPPEVVRAVKNVKLRGIRSFLLLAVDGLPTFRGVAAELLRSTLHVAPSLDAVEKAFDAAKHGGLPEAPTLEITIPSLHDPSLAPQGKHVVHVAIQHTPYKLRPGTWDEATRARLGATVRATLERYAPGLGASIHAERLVTPADLEAQFQLTEGNLYGGELTLDQILFMRPVPGWAHYESPLPGYFFCGDATHPGGAIPGLAGHHAAARIAKTAGR